MIHRTTQQLQHRPIHVCVQLDMKAVQATRTVLLTSTNVHLHPARMLLCVLMAWTSIHALVQLVLQMEIARIIMLSTLLLQRPQLLWQD
jgi:hypothetical protein